MADNMIIVAALIIAVVIIFGGSSILTAYNKTPPVLRAFLDDVDARCDLCLQQFAEVNCDHTSGSKVCTAVRDTYCWTNCTVQLEGK